MLLLIKIIYATESKILRRIIIPDVDDAELEHHPTFAGESHILRPRKDGWNLDTIKAHVKAYTGIEPPSSRCILVHKDTNEILDADFNADPALDAHHSGHKIILHPTAKVGDVWSPK